MKYKAPEIDNKPYYVPVVVKSKDYLVGYIHAMDIYTAIFKDCINKIGLDIDVSRFDICLDSNRFNDILADGKRASECSPREMQEYIKKLIEERMQRTNEEHPDNNNDILKDAILKIDCPCGLGFYVFNKIEEIPETPLKCSNCGRIILDYTDHYDSEFEFDGKKEIKYGN